MLTDEMPKLPPDRILGFFGPGVSSAGTAANSTIVPIPTPVFGRAAVGTEDAGTAERILGDWVIFDIRGPNVSTRDRADCFDFDFKDLGDRLEELWDAAHNGPLRFLRDRDDEIVIDDPGQVGDPIPVDVAADAAGTGQSDIGIGGLGNDVL